MLVGRSVIISLKSRKSHFHAPIRVLVCDLSQSKTTNNTRGSWAEAGIFLGGVAFPFHYDGAPRKIVIYYRKQVRNYKKQMRNGQLARTFISDL